jgi:hypothetical protein
MREAIAGPREIVARVFVSIADVSVSIAAPVGVRERSVEVNCVAAGLDRARVVVSCGSLDRGRTAVDDGCAVVEGNCR